MISELAVSLSARVSQLVSLSVSQLARVSQLVSAASCAGTRRKKYMLSKEKVYASSSSEGKGIRMIIDFLRDPMSCPVSEARHYRREARFHERA